MVGSVSVVVMCCAVEGCRAIGEVRLSNVAGGM